MTGPETQGLVPQRHSGLRPCHVTWLVALLTRQKASFNPFAVTAAEAGGAMQQVYVASADQVRVISP